MGQTSSNLQHVTPLDMSKPVNIVELEKLSEQIESAAKKCSQDRAVISSKYDAKILNLCLDSCVVSFTYEENHYQTFDLIRTKFQSKAKSFELGVDVLPDPYDYSNGETNAYFYEKSKIKIIF